MNDFIYKEEDTNSFSASSAVEFKTYRAHKRGNKTWFVPINGDPNMILYHDPADQEGFGGREIAILIKGGDVQRVKGPWQVNADALKKDTGIDLTDRYVTFGFIADIIENRFHEKGLCIGKGMHYKDTEPTIGPFDRIEKLAQEYANRLERRVAYFFRSQGGSTSYVKEPLKTVKGD